LKLNVRYGLATVGYMTGIFVLSASQLNVIPASRLVLKVLHVPLFAGLAACVLMGLGQGPWSETGSWQLYGLVGVVAGGYAAFDEWHQSFVPGRTASVGDFLLDCLGIALYLGIYRLIVRGIHDGR